MGIHILIGGLIGTLIQPNMVRLMEEVRDGKLDFALTKPDDAQLLVSVRDVRIWRCGRRDLGRDRARLRRSARLTRRPARRAGLRVALALGAVMIYCFWL